MSPKWVQRLSLLNVGVNVLIVVTGGAVRLTDSGLGCPSWPNCQPDSFHATAEMGIHGAIEWGNRLLVGFVGVVAVATLLAAILRRPRRRSLIWLSALVVAGIPAQAIIGGLTVLSGLNPWVVGLHFLASTGVVAAAYVGWTRSGEPDGRVQPVVPAAIRTLAWTAVGAAFLSIVLGVVVTGSGPHAGDPDSPRTGLDPALTAHIHAQAVFFLVGLCVALAFALRATHAPAAPRRALWVLLAVIAAQGAVGFTQYFTGLPELLVGAHMLGSMLLWIAVLRLALATRKRLPAEGPPRDVLIFEAADDEDDEADAESAWRQLDTGASPATTSP